MKYFSSIISCLFLTSCGTFEATYVPPPASVVYYSPIPPPYYYYPPVVVVRPHYHTFHPHHR